MEYPLLKSSVYLRIFSLEEKRIWVQYSQVSDRPSLNLSVCRCEHFLTQSKGTDVKQTQRQQARILLWLFWDKVWHQCLWPQADSEAYCHMSDNVWHLSLCGFRFSFPEISELSPLTTSLASCLTFFFLTSSHCPRYALQSAITCQLHLLWCRELGRHPQNLCLWS